MKTYGLRCKGCGEPIKPGGCVYVTVTRAQHVASFPSHENHKQATRVAALEDLSWQRDQSHGPGRGTR